MPIGGAGQDDGGGLHDAAQCRRLSSAPRASGKLTRIPPPVDEIARAAIVLEPLRRADAEMHGDSQRQRTSVTMSFTIIATVSCAM